MLRVVADWSALVRPRDHQPVNLFWRRRRRAVEFRLQEFVDRHSPRMFDDFSFLCARNSRTTCRSRDVDHNTALR